MTFLFGNRFIGTGEGDGAGSEANTRLSGGFLEPMYVFEGEDLLFSSVRVWSNYSH